MHTIKGSFFWGKPVVYYASIYILFSSIALIVHIAQTREITQLKVHSRRRRRVLNEE